MMLVLVLTLLAIFSVPTVIALSISIVAKGIESRNNRKKMAALAAIAQSRKVKRILAVLPNWPEVTQVGDGDSRPMSSLLREWGYALAHIQSTDELAEKAHHFHPRMLIALSQDAARLEAALANQETLAHLPVIYIGSKAPASSVFSGLIPQPLRLHWKLFGNDTELSQVLSLALGHTSPQAEREWDNDIPTGDLQDGRLWEILDRLAALRKTGILRIETAHLVGEIIVVAGEVHQARLGDLAGAEAVAGLMELERELEKRPLERGRYAFSETSEALYDQATSSFDHPTIEKEGNEYRDEVHNGHGP